MASFVAPLLYLFAGFTLAVAATYVGATLALRRYFEDESPGFARIEE